MNQLREAPPEQKPKKRSRRFQRLQDFDFKLNQENATRLIPFVLYLSLWVIIYIANHHYGEKTLGKTDKLRKELKDLKADFYTTNAELSNNSIQSEVIKKVEPLGLKELTVPPQRMKLINK
jgi:hypothetical protein